jgi:drug/metabolite transporter (DMT)-like permease
MFELNMITLSLIAGIAYSLQNFFEKTIFNSPSTNVNDYFILRVFFMLILFSGVYLLFPQSLAAGNHKSSNNLVSYIKKYWALTLASAIFVVVSVYYMNVGLSRYDITSFTPIFLITYLVVNMLFGFIIFKDKVTYSKIIGIGFAIASIILFNRD